MKFEMIPVDRIDPNPKQPREAFPRSEIKELATSIPSEDRMIQPIIVREKKGRYQIIAGERRWRAANFAELKKIPAVIRDTAEEDILLESLIENLHRKDLTSTERENAVTELWRSGEWETYEDLGSRLGKRGYWVSENVSVTEVRAEDDISATVATETISRASRIKDKKSRKKLLKKIEKGEVAPSKVRDYAEVIEKAPEPVREAILEDEIDFEDAKPLVEHGIPEDLETATVEELSKRKKERDQVKHEIEEMSKIETDSDIAVLDGSLKSKGIKVEPSHDEIRYRQFETIAITVKNWRTFHLKKIKNEKFREMAIERIREARDALDALLGVLEKGG